jgi:branched-chain amino acid aminotransferase
MSTITIWHLTQGTSRRIRMQDSSSLDSVTRQLPEGYYSTFRTFDGCSRVLGLGAHLRRLYEPVSEPEVDALELRRQLRVLLKPYRPDEARLRAIMTRQGQLYLAIEPLRPLPREVYEKGVRVTTTKLERQYPRLKSTSFIGRSDSERKQIAQQGVFEALLVKDGKILEGMTSNFFYVLQEGSLGTARDDILLGVTRDTVIDVARGRGVEVVYEPSEWNQTSATALREAFITSSSRGIVPVIQIDAISVGQGSPGPITRDLMAAYDAYVLAHAETI